jgi:hypothetical protein
MASKAVGFVPLGIGVTVTPWAGQKGPAENSNQSKTLEKQGVTLL